MLINLLTALRSFAKSAQRALSTEGACEVSSRVNESCTPASSRARVLSEDGTRQGTYRAPNHPSRHALRSEATKDL